MRGVSDRNKKIDGMLKKIDELKSEIMLTFMRTQNLIISSYFDKAFENISNLEEVENYRRKLYTFNDYYVNKMEQLENKYNALENGNVENAIKLITKKESKIISFFKALKKLIFGEKNVTEKIN